jgi:hypothetical protein
MADMGWSKYIRDQDNAAHMEEQAREQDMLPWLCKFSDYDSPHEMYRAFYKYTDCGPWVSVHVDGYWVHCGNLHTLGRWDQMARRGEIVDEVLIGSIVEGCDQDADSSPVRLCDLRSRRSKRGAITRASVRAAFARAITDVNDSAVAIWNDTHGCDTCLAHWAEEGAVDELGQEARAVWPDCPDCKGHGAIL